VQVQTSQKRHAFLLSYAPLFLWMGIIFFFSSPEASSEQTSRIIGPLLHFFFPAISTESETLVHAVVRKCAHFTEYAVLAYLACRAFSASAAFFVKQRRFLFALILVVAIASLDEFNQSFEPSRTSSVWDVLLDVFGGTVMLLIVILQNFRTGRSI
jgi:VanZ family protein